MAAQRKHPEELREHAVKVVLEIREQNGQGHGSPPLVPTRGGLFAVPVPASGSPAVAHQRKASVQMNDLLENPRRWRDA
ncbi:MAG TPA: hypothetical protein VE733_07355 [Streptosporangiaceae bacterium]|jgi:hypothetical protein|nr:hypothetical protein [Streptosporangiaceae bacterium]